VVQAWSSPVVNTEIEAGHVLSGATLGFAIGAPVNGGILWSVVVRNLMQRPNYGNTQTLHPDEGEEQIALSVNGDVFTAVYG
jgi:hypothetical protein